MISVEEWKKHFLSVSEIIGVYECRYWDIINYGDHWKIIGKQCGFKYGSVVNNGIYYTDLDILLKDISMLENEIRDLVEGKY